jgi:hypothetical protein
MAKARPSVEASEKMANMLRAGMALVYFVRLDERAS